VGVGETSPEADSEASWRDVEKKNLVSQLVIDPNLWSDRARELVLSVPPQLSTDGHNSAGEQAAKAQKARAYAESWLRAGSWRASTQGQSTATCSEDVHIHTTSLLVRSSAAHERREGR
jgi:hypothetical protein